MNQQSYFDTNLYNSFWRFIVCGLTPNDCWQWMASKRKGYGLVKVYLPERKTRAAHRISYSLANNLPLNEIKGIILHSCDNPSCVNPQHLREGSYQDNINDMKARGRERKAHGERNGNAKLADKQIKLIFDLVNSGLSYSEVGRRFHVHYSQISNIYRRRQRKNAFISQ
jgi:hypothetical protein